MIKKLTQVPQTLEMQASGMWPPEEVPRPVDHAARRFDDTHQMRKGRARHRLAELRRAPASEKAAKLFDVELGELFRTRYRMDAPVMTASVAYPDAVWGNSPDKILHDSESRVAPVGKPQAREYHSGWAFNGSPRRHNDGKVQPICAPMLPALHSKADSHSLLSDSHHALGAYSRTDEMYLRWSKKKAVELEGEPVPIAFSLKSSIWAPRAKSSDAGALAKDPGRTREGHSRVGCDDGEEEDEDELIGLIDTEAVFTAATLSDWGHTTAREGDIKFVFGIGKAKWAPAILTTVREIILSNAAAFHQLFIYYSSCNGDSTSNMFSLDKEAYSLMISDSEISKDDDADIDTEERQDLDVTFVAVNKICATDEVLEEQKRAKATGDDDGGRNILTLNRYEMIEWMVRMGLAWYPEKSFDQAVRTFVEQNLLEGLKRKTLSKEDGWICGPLHDANAFRRQFCYCEETCLVLQKNKETLKALYNVYAFGDGDMHCKLNKATKMAFEEFLAFLDDMHWVEEISPRRIGLIFAWSRMLTIDEYRDRAKNVQINFEDFLEAIVRIASVKALPTPADMQRFECENNAGLFLKKAVDDEFTDEFGVNYERWIEQTEAKQCASGATGGPMGPIWERLRSLMQVIVFKVQDGAAKTPRYPYVKLTEADVTAFRKRDKGPAQASDDD